MANLLHQKSLFKADQESKDDNDNVDNSFLILKWNYKLFLYSSPKSVI